MTEIVGPKAYYQSIFHLGNLSFYVRNDCEPRQHWHVVRGEWITGPGRYLGHVISCTGDLEAAITAKWEFVRKYR